MSIVGHNLMSCKEIKRRNEANIFIESSILIYVFTISSAFHSPLRIQLSAGVTSFQSEGLPVVFSERQGFHDFH